MLIASCHCGAVRIEVSHPPSELTQCNCSICRRYAAQFAFYTRTTARVICAVDATSAYIWNDRVIEFHHCNTCGCLTHYESVDTTNDSRIAVNARMMSPEDTTDLKVRTFDGADTWRYLD